MPGQSKPLTPEQQQRALVIRQAGGLTAIMRQLGVGIEWHTPDGKVIGQRATRQATTVDEDEWSAPPVVNVYDLMPRIVPTPDANAAIRTAAAPEEENPYVDEDEYTAPDPINVYDEMLKGGR